MKRLLLILAIAVLTGPTLSCAHAQAPISIDYFYNHLDSYGDWRQVGDYGYCWQPRGIDNDWSPYSDGRWVYTDAGWTWDSDEPYSWAVYHYGRWVNVSSVGWVWVPGTEWGPGWVSWRRSSRYVGWAPLPPEALFLSAIGFSSWVDDYYNIGPGSYRFIENRNMGARHLNSVFIQRTDNISIIQQTTNITNITYQNNIIHNGGPDYDQQSRQSAEPIRRYKLDRRHSLEADASQKVSDHFNSQINGESLSVLAPSISNQSAKEPRKHSEKLDVADINHGWNDAGSPESIAAMRVRLKSHTKAPESLPKPLKSGEPAVNDSPPGARATAANERSSGPKQRPKDLAMDPNAPPPAIKEKIPGMKEPEPATTPKNKDSGKPAKEKPKKPIPAPPLPTEPEIISPMPQPKVPEIIRPMPQPKVPEIIRPMPQPEAPPVIEPPTSVKKNAPVGPGGLKR